MCEQQKTGILDALCGKTALNCVNDIADDGKTPAPHPQGPRAMIAALYVERAILLAMDEVAR